jgi:hypothetical protein
MFKLCNGGNNGKLEVKRSRSTPAVVRSLPIYFIIIMTNMFGDITLDQRDRFIMNRDDQDMSSALELLSLSTS